MKRVLFLIAVLLIPTTLAEQFPVQNINSGFVGWVEDSNPDLGNYRLSYPSVSDGEDTNMAQNGPFAVVVFMPDDGESVDQYIWLQDGLSKWGYITLVVDSNWDSIEIELMEWNNGTSTDLMGAEGMFALNHISLSGHGTGAHSAAEIMKSGMYGIDGLFGLGFDGASTSETSDVVLSSPSSALFLTGTTDEVAPANENVLNYLEDWPGAWQVMKPLGANHLGYQESDTFFERLGDGDSTMGREGQQNHALAHIVPYLNLSLRGDDSAYQTAFNREDKSVTSDPDSHYEEDLSRSRLYDMSNISSESLLIMVNQSVTISANVTLRNGGTAFGNVSCHLPNGNQVLGDLQNGIASCLVNGSMLSPGMAIVELRIADHSFSDWLEIMVTRIGMPLQIADPLPEVVLDQHSSVVVTPDLFANDPDGEVVVIVDAQFIDNNQSILEVNNSLSELSITHVNIPEWDGTMTMQLVLAAGDDVANLTVNVTVLPVDDRVVQHSVIPQQQTVEDGVSIVVDVADFVSDPEGQIIQVTLAREYTGLRINTTMATILIDPQTHWNGAELVELYVSDGTTEQISIFIPINIAPIDDIIQFSESSLEIDMNEDEVTILNLQNYTIDVDGDDLIYQVTGFSDIVGVSLSGNELIIAGNPDLFGISQFELNVSDGTNVSFMTLIINTKSVPDLPIVGISTVSVVGDSISVLWTISDVDGDVGLLKSVTFAGEAIDTGTECTGGTLLTCVTDYRLTSKTEGLFTVEAKVWDSHAQEWSNTASKDVDVKSVVTLQDEPESEVSIGYWVLPIGLGLLVILLVGYMIQSRKD
ncbi:MAG: hypothetical protein ACKVG2_06160 [Candidatus Poseidoniales archaeon]